MLVFIHIAGLAAQQVLPSFVFINIAGLAGKI
jgi:hypothetical protein